MGYPASNAAYAYDMQLSTQEAYAPEPAAPARGRRAAFDVVPGAGRETSQDVSPQFTHCVKVFAALVAVFFALGLFRVTLAGATASTLNTAASVSEELTTAQEESSDLEVMRSVYGSPTRIRDLAQGYGMVAAEGGVTLDFTEHVPADGAAATE